MASSTRGYWSRSLELLTRDEGWYKPLLVLSAARLVPIVGPFGADGYGLEWARLTAWGVDSSPKQKNVDVGGCIKAGARAFVVGLGYGLAFAAIRFVLNLILGSVIGGFLGVVVIFAAVVLTLVAKLRATIYQRIGAGYEVERIYDMVKHDYKGLLRILGLILLLGLAFCMLAGMLYGAALLAKAGPLVLDFMDYERYGYPDDWMIVNSVLSLFASALPILLVMSYLLGVVKAFIQLIVITSVGLWMRQFDVAHWGESSDPLPSDAPAASEGYGASSTVPHAYGQGYGSSAPEASMASAGASQATMGYAPQDVTAYEPQATTTSADEQVETFPIPMAIDSFPLSSEEAERVQESAMAPTLWDTPVVTTTDVVKPAMATTDDADSAATTMDATPVENIDTPVDLAENAVEDIHMGFDSLDALVEAATDAPVLGVEELGASDDVPMFSLADVDAEQEPATTKHQTPEQVLTQMKSAIEAATMTDSATDLFDETLETEVTSLEASEVETEE